MSHKRVFIIHMSRLGDMVQSLPAVKLLKEDNPDCRITYMGIKDFCTILEDIPWIDDLVTLSWQQVSSTMGEAGAASVSAVDELLQTIPQLRADYDLLINFTHNRFSSYLTEKVKASVKRGRIFSENNELVISGKWAKYLFAMAKHQEYNLLNLVDIYMGMAGVRNRPAGQFLPIDRQAKEKADSLLRGTGIQPGKPLVGFQVGTSSPAKTWPIEHFVQLGEIIRNEIKAQIIIFGSAKETALAEQFGATARYPFVSLVGKTPLRELPALFSNVDVLVGSDTGPMHIAAAVGTKLVGIYAGTAYFGVTGPYGVGHIAVQSDYPCAPCMKSNQCANPLCRMHIRPELVARAVKLSLGMDGNGPVPPCAGARLYQSSFSQDGTLRYELIDEGCESFLSWLSSSRHVKALISQALWSQWLGLPSEFIIPGFLRKGGILKEIKDDFTESSSTHIELYSAGMSLCQRIIDQFQKGDPNIQTINSVLSSLSQVEERLKELEGPLPILKDIHEYCIAETEVCEFPKLAYQFLEKYSELKKMTVGFEKTLQGMPVSPL